MSSLESSFGSSRKLLSPVALLWALLLGPPIFEPFEEVLPFDLLLAPLDADFTPFVILELSLPDADYSKNFGDMNTLGKVYIFCLMMSWCEITNSILYFPRSS